jgi:hypothetical protein
MRIDSSSGVGSCSIELRQSLELAVVRIMAKKEFGCAENTSFVI